MDPAYAIRITDAFAQGTQVRVHDGVHLLDDIALEATDTTT
jgi:hypothetical protein